MAKVVLKFETNDTNGKKLEIDDGSIVSLNSLSQSSSDSSSINYGCIANTGSMTIVDFNSNIAKQIKDGTMPSSNVDVDLYVNNNKIQSHITTNSTYDTNTNEFSVSVTNRIADWDILKYKGYVYQNKSATLYEILADVFSTLEDVLDDALSDIIIYTYPENGSYSSKQGTIKEYLQLISVKYPSIEYGYTIRQMIDDICTIAQLQCFIDDDNNVKFISARPVISLENTLMIVDKSIILGDIDEDLFVKNKYDGVEMSEINVNDIINYNTPVNSSTSDITNFSYSGGNTYRAYDAKYGVGAKIEFSYSSGSYDFILKSDDNLKQILEINMNKASPDSDGYYNVLPQNGELPFSINYNRYYGSFKNEAQALLDIQASTPYGEDDSVFSTTNYSGNVNFSSESSGAFASKIQTEYIFRTYNELNYPDNSYIRVKVVGDKVYVKYNVISKVVVYDLSTNRYENFREDSSIYKDEGYSVSISIYGNQREITFPEVSASSKRIDSAKTKANISVSSKLLQAQTTITGVKISDVIKHNILTDYKNGLPTLKLEVVCADMYDQNGNIVRNWKLGEILKNNDFVQLSNKKLKINSREFVYDGSPSLKLEIKEAKEFYSENLVFEHTYYDTDTGRMFGYNCKLYTELSGMIVLPSTYNDGKHGVLPVLRVSNEPNTEEHSNVEKLYIPSSVKSIDIAGNKSLKEVVFMGEGLEVIEQWCFSQCSSLQKIKIPSSVKDIGPEAFSDCVSLESIIIPKSVSGSMSGTFINCSNLKSVTFEKECKITAIYDIFDECLSLESINLPEKLNYLGWNSFKNTKIKNIECPESLKEIGSNAFGLASELENVKINDGLTAIYEWAFYNCKKLKHIFIPESVITIGDESSFGWTAPDYSPFLDCSSDLVIYCEATSKPSGWISGWNYYSTTEQLQVKWGYTREQYEAEVGLS